MARSEFLFLCLVMGVIVGALIFIHFDLRAILEAVER